MFILKALLLFVAVYTVLDTAILRDIYESGQVAFGTLFPMSGSPNSPEARNKAFFAEVVRQRHQSTVRRQALLNGPAAPSQGTGGYFRPPNLHFGSLNALVRSSGAVVIEKLGLSWLWDAPTSIGAGYGFPSAEVSRGTVKVLKFTLQETTTPPLLANPQQLLAALNNDKADEKAINVSIAITFWTAGTKDFIVGPKHVNFIARKGNVIPAVEESLRRLLQHRLDQKQDSNVKETTQPERGSDMAEGIKNNAGAPSAIVGIQVGDSVRVFASSDLCFGLKGFWTWHILPNENLVIDVSIRGIKV